MREGRRRPSLYAWARGISDPDNAAMREGRRRPSLDMWHGYLKLLIERRNEGGAPAPLVVHPDVETWSL